MTAIYDNQTERLQFVLMNAGLPLTSLLPVPTPNVRPGHPDDYEHPIERVARIVEGAGAKLMLERMALDQVKELGTPIPPSSEPLNVTIAGLWAQIGTSRMLKKYMDDARRLQIICLALGVTLKPPKAAVSSLVSSSLVEKITGKLSMLGLESYRPQATQSAPIAPPIRVSAPENEQEQWKRFTQSTPALAIPAGEIPDSSHEDEDDDDEKPLRRVKSSRDRLGSSDHHSHRSHRHHKTSRSPSKSPRATPRASRSNSNAKPFVLPLLSVTPPEHESSQSVSVETSTSSGDNSMRRVPHSAPASPKGRRYKKE